MEIATIHIRPARASEIAEIHALIERAYRGESARSGWTHEADMLEGARTDDATLAAVVANSGERLLAATQSGRIIGCVQITKKSDDLCYLSLLTVDPALQAAGLGKRLFAAAEAEAKQTFRARTMELSVISRRRELIAYYERRGYALTGELRPFPVEVAPPLELAVMTKPLE